MKIAVITISEKEFANLVAIRKESGRDPTDAEYIKVMHKDDIVEHIFEKILFAYMSSTHPLFDELVDAAEEHLM